MQGSQGREVSEKITPRENILGDTAEQPGNPKRKMHVLSTEGRIGLNTIEVELPYAHPLPQSVNGNQFTVVDGTTGLLFEPGNVDDLCRKLERLLDDNQLRERFGQNGRQRFEVPVHGLR
jgi:hypothetical protein